MKQYFIKVSGSGFYRIYRRGNPDVFIRQYWVAKEAIDACASLNGETSRQVVAL